MDVAFSKAQKIEARAFEDLMPLFQRMAYNGQFAVTSKGKSSEFFQKLCGDVIVNIEAGKSLYIEVKAEEEERYGNFFLEVFSNKARRTPGWMFYLDCDLLFYYFLSNKLLYSIDFRKLCQWAFHRNGKRGPKYPGRIWDYPLKQQGKYAQKNDTWGACVPIGDIDREVGFNLVHQLEKQ